MKKKQFKHGDIFSVGVGEDQYIFGKILFDVDKQYFAKYAVNTNKYFDAFKGCILIETYFGVYQDFEDIAQQRESAVKSAFISNDAFDEFDEWSVIGNEIVNPIRVSFPEVLNTFHPDIFFAVGEVSKKVSISEDEREKIGVYPAFGSGYWEVVATLDFSGREDLIEDGDKLDSYFQDSDLRYVPDARTKIYSEIGEDQNINYYDLAVKNGFDLARFY